MPTKSATERAKAAKRDGKSASTQAGEFVREEIENIRKGKHGARSAKQAIAIGLSKARRAGVKLPVPKKGKVSEKTRRAAVLDNRKGESARNKKPNPRRSRASTKALKREGQQSVSHLALARQAKAAARERTAAERSAIAKKAARTRARNKK